jgi:hypothetical protein
MNRTNEENTEEKSSPWESIPELPDYVLYTRKTETIRQTIERVECDQVEPISRSNYSTVCSGTGLFPNCHTTTLKDCD